jgi:hypothetical protein
MLQNASIRAVPTEVGTYPEHDIDLSFSYFDALYEGSNNLAPGQPICPGQPIPHLGGKRIQSPNNQAQFLLERSFLHELLGLLFQAGDALAQPRDPRLKLRLLDQSLRITIDQPRQPLAQFAQLRIDVALLITLARC